MALQDMTTSRASWFERHPFITMICVLMILLLAIELLMHALYGIGALPNNVIYMTQLEKTGYRSNVNQITYQENIPRRAEGITTYTQKGIPNQFIHFDSQGMRLDNYHSESNTKDTIVGVFGDSYTDALQVGQGEAYPALVEDILRESGCHLDVRNYGLGATGTATQFLRYQQLKNAGEKFDHVVVAIFPGNDILNNSKTLDTRVHNPYQFYPYLVFSNGHLVRDDLVRPKGSRIAKHVRTFFKNYSHLASTFLNLKLIYSAQRAATLNDNPGNQSPLARHRKVTEAVYGEPFGQEWAEAWQLTEEIIKQWKTMTESAGETLGLVFLTESIQIAPDYPNPGELNLDYPNKRLADIASRHDIHFLDFLPVARSFITGNSIGPPYLSWEYDGHYSQLGHKLLADHLADTFAGTFGCLLRKAAES